MSASLERAHVSDSTPDAKVLRQQLASVGEGLEVVVAMAAGHPTPERLETLGIRLARVSRLVQGLRDALLRADPEEAHHDAD